MGLRYKVCKWVNECIVGAECQANIQCDHKRPKCAVAVKTSHNNERDVICSICGSKGCGNVFMLQYNYNFCPNCGRKLTPVS
jgi:hypothetical protein